MINIKRYLPKTMFLYIRQKGVFSVIKMKNNTFKISLHCSENSSDSVFYQDKLVNFLSQFCTILQKHLFFCQILCYNENVLLYLSGES